MEKKIVVLKKPVGVKEIADKSACCTTTHATTR